MNKAFIMLTRGAFNIPELRNRIEKIYGEILATKKSAPYFH
jgi:hypothetical protein